MPNTKAMPAEDLEAVMNVRVLERKVVTLETQIQDLKFRIISNERKAAEEKRRKLGNVVLFI